jgi:hypothetical protein
VGRGLTGGKSVGRFDPLEMRMSFFSYRVNFRATLRPADSALSFTGFSIPKKELLEAGASCRDRFTPSGHYDRMARPPNGPVVVGGVRNVLSNLRCVAYSGAMSLQLGVPEYTVATVAEENKHPGRPYHAIVRHNGTFSVEEFLPQGRLTDPQPQLEGVDWLVTGTPVCWNCDDAELFDRMITDAADHSHVWHLPRGGHVDATDTTRQQWSVLQEAFIETLSSGREEAATRLKEIAEAFRLDREDEYLHSVWGVGGEQELVIVAANGRLEDVGRAAAELGCRRAICVENGGSVALYYVPDPKKRPWLPLVSAPNLRPPGTAFVFFALPKAGFRVSGHS